MAATRSKTVRIPVADKNEGENLLRALNDPATRAFVSIVGALLPLGKRAQTRILNFVADKLDDDSARLTIESTGDQHNVVGALPMSDREQ